MSEDLNAVIEAVLLVAVEPVAPGLLAELLEVPLEEIEKALDALALDYESAHRGFVLARIAGERGSRPTPTSPPTSSDSPTATSRRACRRPHSRPWPSWPIANRCREPRSRRFGA